MTNYLQMILKISSYLTRVAAKLCGLMNPGPFPRYASSGRSVTPEKYAKSRPKARLGKGISIRATKALVRMLNLHIRKCEI